MEKPTKGLGALEYGKFRLNRQGESVVAVSNEDEVRVKTGTVTDSGNTLMVAGQADKGTRVKGFLLSREGGSAVAISLREGTDGELKYTTYLKDDGDFVRVDLSHTWALSINKSLYVYASGGCNVHVTVEYDGPADSVQESTNLTDSMTMAEAQAFAWGQHSALTDAQSETEAISKFAAGKKVTDSMTITDAAVAKVVAFKLALGDTLAIAESLGGTRFLALSEVALTIAESSTRVQG